VFKGTHVTHPAAKTFRGEHVELVSLSPDAGEPMDVYADGERVGPLPAVMDAVRDALVVRVPRRLRG
jgi:diacylglycerol kinase family enzyme